MERLLLDHFKQPIVIMYGHMPAVQVCVKLLEAEAH